MKKAALLLVAVSIVLPWVLYLREGSRPPVVPPPAREVARVETPPAAPAPPGEASSAVVAKDPLDLRVLAEQAAAEEARRIKQYEMDLARLEDALRLAEAYTATAHWERTVDVLEPLLKEFPKIELTLLDGRDLKHRAGMLRARMALSRT